MKSRSGARSVEIHLPSREADVGRWSRGEVAGTVVKENSSRTVWRVPAGDPALYVKRFPPSAVSDRAAKEARLLGALEAAGIPCPRLVATARDRAGTYVLTEEIAPARSLQALLAAGDPDRRSLLRSLSALTRRLHDAGFEHQDYHTGNVLVRGRDLFVLDVHRARRRKSLPRNAALDGIAFAALSFSDLVSLTDQLRFIRGCGVGTRAEERDVFRRLRRFRDRHARSRQARCLKESTGFGVRNGIYFRRGADPEALRTQVGRLGRTVAKESVSPLPGGLFVKRTPRARARKIWEHAHGLSVRGIPTPRLDACGPGWVAGEWIEAPNLGDVARDRFPGLGRGERDEFLFRLARAVRKLHDRGVYHADLKSSNVLVRGDTFLFVDLDRVSFSADVPDRGRSFNLAQLNASVHAAVTRADRLRFLRAYMGCDRARWRQFRAWVREIMKRTIARKHLWPPR